MVKKVSKEERKSFENNPDRIEEELLEYLYGFSRLFNDIVAAQKVVVGHNLFTDLLLMYNQFFRKLPGRSFLLSPLITRWNHKEKGFVWSLRFFVNLVGLRH